MNRNYPELLAGVGPMKDRLVHNGVSLDSAIPLPPQARVVRARARVPDNVKRAIERYSEAYKRVFGVLPEVTFTNPYIRVHGQAQGVKLARLKEMTKQLKWRAGA